ncbi:MAG: hypothetical protein CVU67_02870 [Deltaproteobacteria bacterium HGW-Deltaproteobacteria-24]|jgi:hypothetical protein|nr:MAG: hypothetical protein CVU67_02870 [Deltaproteobacteria bacterium HGW-Deltaproteobacteria-24]
MSKITLEVNDKHLSEVLIILKSLKTSMIQNIQCDSQKQTNKEFSHNDKIITASKTSTSRYLSPSAFKEKLKK